MSYPSFEELRHRNDAPPRSSWGLFGDIGTIARLGSDSVLSGCATVQTGEVFRLDYALDSFDPPASATRRVPSHHIFQKRPTHRDDFLDSFYLQGSSQIDGLRHQAHPEYGFYNGAPSEQIIEGGGLLGIESWAKRGIVGRGVLVDVDRFLVATRGAGLDHGTGEAFTVDDVEDALKYQQCDLKPNDILMLRTGWASHYHNDMSISERRELPNQLVSPGLEQSERTLEWLWDRELVMVAADNVAVESLPTVAREEFREISPDGRLHPVLIALMGMPLGELWDLDLLAQACCDDRRYSCLVVSSPLNLRGGVGSPANVVAIR